MLDAFLQAMAKRGLTLYPEQEEAILELGCGNGEFARELAKRDHRGVDWARDRSD